MYSQLKEGFGLFPPRVPRCAVWLAAGQRDSTPLSNPQWEVGVYGGCREEGTVPVHLCLSQGDCGGEQLLCRFESDSTFVVLTSVLCWWGSNLWIFITCFEHFHTTGVEQNSCCGCGMCLMYWIWRGCGSECDMGCDMKIAALSNWQMDSQKVCMWGMISYPHTWSLFVLI